MLILVFVVYGFGFVSGYYTNERVLSGQWFWRQQDADPIPCLMDAGDQTSEDVISFPARDKTHFLKYDPNNFVCRDFAETVRCQAKEEGMNAYGIIILYEIPPHHMIVGLPADGDEIIYYEPVVGSIVHPKIGEPYLGGDIVQVLYYVDLKGKYMPIGESPPYSEAQKKYY